MQCTQCGELFEGRFCPRCGTPASAPVPAAAVAGWPCSRCGTVYVGNFCPRCGQPTSVYFPAYAPRPSGARSVLSVLWTIAMVAFLLVFALNIVGLLVGPSIVVPGIQGLRQGDTVNADLDTDGTSWSFLRASLASSGTRPAQGGNPGGYLEIVSSGNVAPNSAGYWNQSFEVSGSEPFAARFQLDVRVELGSSTTSAVVYVLIDNESAAGSPDTTRSVAELTFTRTSDWASAGTFRTFERFSGPGTYFLRLLVATTTAGPGTATTVGFDNIRLHWTTDEGVILWLPLPLPVVLGVSQDISLFLGYFILLVLVLLGAIAYHALRERKEAVAAFRAPLESIGVRLRNRSALLTLGQVWVANWFFDYVLVWILIAIGLSPTGLNEPVASNGWSLLYDLTNASVYEEFAFRLLLIGLPMVVGSFVLRAIEVNRSGGIWRGPVTPGRYLFGSLRYLFGGTVRRTSTKETLLAAWFLLLATSVLFGLAHVQGYGWWKVLPSAVAGLVFGYLFLRHGIAAAILGHFTQDYFVSLYLLSLGGNSLYSGLYIFQDLILLGLVVAGAGFFVWYLIYAWKHLTLLVSRFAPPPKVRYPRAAPSAPPSTVLPSIAMPYATPSSEPLPTSAMPRDPTVVPREYMPTYRPPPYGYPPVRFQCPYCGWVEARYDAGRFTCARCGKTT